MIRCVEDDVNVKIMKFSELEGGSVFLLACEEADILYIKLPLVLTSGETMKERNAVCINSGNTYWIGDNQAVIPCSAEIHFKKR